MADDLGFDELSMEPVVSKAGSPEALTEADLPILFDQYELLAKVIGRGQDVSAAMALRIETEIRYAGYIAREQRAIHEVQRHENVVIPDDFDYAPLETVTLEAREKLAKIRPRTLAQAGRIPGVSPSDLAQLSIALMKAGKTAAE